MQVVVLYDISPMAVMVTRKGKHWYEFITSLCALIGCGNVDIGYFGNPKCWRKLPNVLKIEEIGSTVQ